MSSLYCPSGSICMQVWSEAGISTSSFFFFFPKVHKDVLTELRMTMECRSNYQLSKSTSA